MTRECLNRESVRIRDWAETSGRRSLTSNVGGK